MTTTFKRLSKVFVCRNQEAGANSTSTAREESKTASSADEPSSIELLGIDALTNHMHVKSVYFFPATLNAAAIREAVGKVLAAHPVLGGRVRSKGAKQWVDWGKDLGVPVYEQRALVYGGQDEGSIAEAMKKHGHSFIKGPMNHSINDDRAALLIVTLTEIEYRETASPWSCRPAACSQQESMLNLGEEESEQVEQAEEGGVDPSELVARYAVGIAISHDIADGCSIAQFLLSLARASMRKSVQPSVHDRSLLLRSLPDPASLPLGPDGLYPGYRVLGTVDRLYMMGSMMFGTSGCDFLRLTFSKAELDAIKAKAMEPLQGTEQFVSSSNALAAHLWPLLSEITNGGVMPAKLLPYHTAINWRRALGLPENYFGNCATFRAAEEASADEGLTELAIKVRKTSACAEGVVEELAWMQGLMAKGKVSSVMFSAMLDALLGTRPFFGWDDVSGFLPPSIPGVVLCGVPSVRIDLPMFPLPGIAMVLPHVSPDGSVGKAVVLALKRADAARALSPPYQARIHAFAPNKRTAGAEDAVIKESREGAQSQ